MRNAKRFPFIERRNQAGEANVFPCIPITLSYHDCVLEVVGLLDTGASLNILPYHVGLALGAVWEEQTLSIPLAGNLAPVEARGLAVVGQVSDFPPVRLAFAWAKSNDPPIILGQLNFFMEFDVCFYRSQLAFEVCPKFREN
ncbi:MAG: retroviral-like aspartic protease [Planktothrix sp.]